jgi:acetyl esterase/lipase
MLVNGFKEVMFGPSLLAKVIAHNRMRGEKVSVHRVKYGNDSQQYLLFFLPTDGTSGKPLVYFIHGGAWRLGSPELFRFIGLFFARLGFPTVLPAYRRVPRCRYPAQLLDGMAGLTKSIAWMNSRGIRHQGILLGGYSAGAQLASLIAYARQADINALGIKVTGLLLVSGPLNFSACKHRIIKLAILDYLGTIFGWGKADPIRFLENGSKFPVLCVHGTGDTLVDVENSVSFTEKANAYGKMADLLLVHGATHTDVLEIFWNKRKETETLIGWLQNVTSKTGWQNNLCQ